MQQLGDTATGCKGHKNDGNNTASRTRKLQRACGDPGHTVAQERGVKGEGAYVRAWPVGHLASLASLKRSEVRFVASGKWHKLHGRSDRVYCLLCAALMATFEAPPSGASCHCATLKCSCNSVLHLHLNLLSSPSRCDDNKQQFQLGLSKKCCLLMRAATSEMRISSS